MGRCGLLDAYEVSALFSSTLEKIARSVAHAGEMKLKQIWQEAK